MAAVGNGLTAPGARLVFISGLALSDGASCENFVGYLNQMFMFGRADLGQLQNALYWLGMLLVPAALAAVFVSSRLFDHLLRCQSPAFVRIANVFGVLVATAVLLLLTQSGLTESWLNWVCTGCLDNGVELCRASPAVPETYHQFLVEQYLARLGQIRLWGTLGGLPVALYSALLLWLLPNPKGERMKLNCERMKKEE